MAVGPAVQGWVASLRRRWLAAILGAVAVGHVAGGELYRLTSDALTPQGDFASLRSVVGPAAFGSRSAWKTWLQAPLPHDVALWVMVAAVCQLVVWLGLGVLAIRAFGLSPLVRDLVLVLAGWSVVRLVTEVAAARALWRGEAPGLLSCAVAVTSVVAWLLVVAIVLAVVRSKPLRDVLSRRLWLLWMALKYQRASAVPVLLVGLLSVVSNQNIWDQLPDVVRTWVDDWSGVRHGLLALGSVLVMSLLLLAIGRRRADRALASFGGGTPPAGPPAYWVWVVLPVVALVGAVLLWSGGPDGTVSGLVLGLFVALPVALLVLSGLVQLWLGASLWQEPARVRDADVGPVTREVGDALAFGLVAVLGIGVVRSYSAPVFARGDSPRHGWDVVLLVAGTSLAVLAVPLLAWLRDRVDRRVAAGAGPAKGALMAQVVAPAAAPGWTVVVARFLPVLAAGFLVALLLVPLPLTRFVGPYALVIGALGSWMLLLAALVVHLQERRPLQLFRLLRMRATPVLTLFVAVPALAALAPSQPGLHLVRTTAHGPAEQPRDSLQTRFDDWYAGAGACDITDAAGRVVRPMLVVAASGGGIRSAVWTASVLDRIERLGACGQSLVLLSSGVSGGSVGLVVARQADAHGLSPQEEVARLTAPDALTAALSGTLVGDLVGGSTGLRVPVLREGDHPRRWLDRAGLMERAWERDVPHLADPWSPAVSGVGGALVLNSTDARLGCRVLVSQLDLHFGTDTSGLDPLARAQNCRARSNHPPASLDLFGTYGACSPQLRWSTAAMLSARFPTVTPAGRVPRSGDCEKTTPDLQLVDGGYAEGSGVGTLADLAPRLSALVRDKNAAAGSTGPFVVPLVAYLEDEVRSDVRVRPPKDPPEVLVPLRATGAKKTLGSTVAQLQRVATAFASPCPKGADPACGDLARLVRSSIPDGVLLIAPPTEPSVTAPLGWTLSRDSRDQLDRALRYQACLGPPRDDTYAGLGPLLDLLGEPASTRCPSSSH